MTEMIRMMKDNVERIVSTEAKAIRLKAAGYRPVEGAAIAVAFPEAFPDKPLEELTAAELRAVAESRGLSGYSSLSKRELLDILRDVI